MLSKEASIQILMRLQGSNPPPQTELLHSNPFELIVATVLSAQCTDKRVNMVTPSLFARCPTPKDLAEIPLEDLKYLIRSINFFNNKAVHLKGLGQRLIQEYGGEVPASMDELTTLPGVGRKTASVVLGSAFGIPAVAVDTHVHRVSNRLGMVQTKTPPETEQALMKKLPKEWWINGHHLLIMLGRYTCTARVPRCGECRVADLCGWKGKIKS